MSAKTKSASRRPINLKALGRRLGLVVAMYPTGKAGAMAAADISEDTLHRYLVGASARMPLNSVAAICEPLNINLMWLLYGDEFPKHAIAPTRTARAFLKATPGAFRPPYGPRKKIEQDGVTRITIKPIKGES